MSNNVSARKDGSNYIASTGPDVCKTPVGSSIVPVPYSSIAFLGSAARVNKTVRHNGKPDFMLNSRTPNSMGTEPGVKKGVAKSGYLGPAAVKVTTGSVFSKKWATASHKDKATINMASKGPTEKKR
ncbi:protein of unknown function [Cognatiyoonia koreensis]|uniref:Uncharacterized protein n=1 Tax=Cognatiyoonia koreensis TaxID=364200 RepID=A0A1I0RTQ7_9RHOB|nr:PAAR-like domain-containing protein [Cognatiyoonia koreensis]SEW44158.1 protein of unknown function [Cognatiyoonia koreensis]